MESQACARAGGRVWAPGCARDPPPSFVAHCALRTTCSVHVILGKRAVYEPGSSWQLSQRRCRQQAAARALSGARLRSMCMAPSHLLHSSPTCTHRLAFGSRLPRARERAAGSPHSLESAQPCRSSSAGCPWWPAAAARRGEAAAALSSRRASTSPAATCLASPPARDRASGSPGRAPGALGMRARAGHAWLAGLVGVWAAWPLPGPLSLAARAPHAADLIPRPDGPPQVLHLWRRHRYARYRPAGAPRQQPDVLGRAHGR